MGKKNKSKAPKGRAAAKQKAKKGSGAGGPHMQYSSPMSRFARQMHDYDDDDDFAPSFKGFAQTNNNTPPSRFSPRDPSVRYRNQAIAFVSAGTNTPVEFDPAVAEEAGQAEAAGQSEEEEEDDDDDDDDDEEDDSDIDDTTIQTNIVMATNVQASETAMADMTLHPSDVNMEDDAPSETPLFVVDTVGDPNFANGWKTNGKRPMYRSTSPAPSDSDSSEEQILYTGRNKSAKAKDTTKHTNPQLQQQTQQSAVQLSNGSEPTKVKRMRWVDKWTIPATTDTPPHAATPDTTTHTAPTDATPHVADDLLKSLQQDEQSSVPTSLPSLEAKGWAAKPSKYDTEVNPDATWAPAPAGSWWRKGKMRPDLDPSGEDVAAVEGRSRTPPKVAFAEPQAEETIASLQADWKAVIRNKKDEVKSTSHEEDMIKLDSGAPKSKRRGKRGRKRDNRSLRGGPIDADDDDDDEAAYDDYMSNLAAQLDGSDDGGHLNGILQTVSVAGPSLVVDGEEIAEDQVLKKSHVEMMNEDESESDSDFSGVIGQDFDALSSTELEDELEYTEKEQWDDEEDLRQRRLDRMTDEQIARMFAKQEEFGYHGDDLVIEGGEFLSTDIEGVGDVASARAGLADISNFSFGRSRNTNGTRNAGPSSRRGVFPNASALADTVEQYGENGFDIMDFDRPSLRPTKRGRKGQLPPEVEALSDEDMKDTIRDTWESDRRKKSLKKAEREALRAEGWLAGSAKKGKQDLSAKYAFGISMEQVHTELRTFLLDDGQTTRPFPPMDKKDRKALHEVANVLNLKSKSVGAGNERHPILVKTQRTPVEVAMIDRAIGLSARGLLSRERKLGGSMAKKGAKGVGGKVGVGRGGGAGAASLRNGEVVGAGAAELGSENFGHRMMEKMGWSKGMALGREGEGRLVPVEQVVRLGTAGLG